MKKLLLAACFVIGATAMSFAQSGGGQGGQGGGRGGFGGTPEQQAKRLQTQLTLTDDQTAKIKVIYEAQTVKRDSIMKAAGDDRSGLRAAMAPLTAATNLKINALLTDEQKAAWKKANDERAARMQNGGGQGGGGTPPPPTR